MVADSADYICCRFDCRGGSKEWLGEHGPCESSAPRGIANYTIHYVCMSSGILPPPPQIQMWAPQTAAARKTPVCYQLNRVTLAEVSREFSAKMLNVCGGLLSPLHQIFMGTHPVVPCVVLRHDPARVCCWRSRHSREQALAVRVAEIAGFRGSYAGGAVCK